MKAIKKRWKLVAGIVAVLVVLGIMLAPGALAMPNDTCTFKIVIPDVVTDDDSNAYVTFWGIATKYYDGDTVTLPLNQDRQWTFHVNGRTGPPQIKKVDGSDLVVQPAAVTGHYCVMDIVIPDIPGNPTVTFYGVPGTFHNGDKVVLPAGDEVAWYLTIHNWDAERQYPNKMVDGTPLVVKEGQNYEAVTFSFAWTSDKTNHKTTFYHNLLPTVDNGDTLYVPLMSRPLRAWPVIYGQTMNIYEDIQVDGTWDSFTWELTNQPPIADAGPDQTVEQTSYEGAEVTLDGSGSTDADSTPGTNDDIVSFKWYEDGPLIPEGEAVENVLFSLGEHTVTLIVTDSGDLWDDDEVVITVGDTTPPVITCPEDITVECKSHEGSVVPLEATAIDICDPDPVITSDELDIYPLGETTVTFTATDDCGNRASDTVIVTVLSPRDIKEKVKNCLSMYIDESKRIGKAIKKIDKSLDPKRWLDETHLDKKHGKKVFDDERYAVKELMHLLKGDASDKCSGITSLTLEYSGGAGADITVDKGTVTDNEDGTYTIRPEDGKEKLSANTKIYVDGVFHTEIHTSCSKPIEEGDIHGDFKIEWLDKVPPKSGKKDQVSDEALACAQEGVAKLVRVDRILAETLIIEAEGTTVIDPKNQDKVDKELEKCVREFEKADKELTHVKKDGTPDPHYDKAINHYKKAWRHAQKALKHAEQGE